MRIGVPKEIKNNEYRVAMTPAGVTALTRHGHQVLIERGAGLGSSIPDAEYERAGALMTGSAAEVFGGADMIIKVKEPLPGEIPMIRKGQILFTYLHLAADKALTEGLLATGCTGIAYETIQMPNGSLPLLTPMSEIAGRMAVQCGAQYLERHNMGRGVLLGGVPGVPPGDVVILGGGITGTQAAKIALGMGANVTILDTNLDRLRYLDDILTGRINVVMSDHETIARSIRYADLLIGAVLIPGAKAPTLVTKEMVATMKPGSVIIDISVDQGGCVETIHPTTHSDPVYVVHDVVHYGVANMPGAVPRTSTFALTNATLPYAVQLANKGYPAALDANPVLAKGLNVHDGKVTYAAVASAHNLPLGK
ncbi:MAG: alanine dehydrogenase [Candidatus Sericytochromatia bacterium]|nr:alanine dehydrogenase [Candidatus Sericytochromatia bacterium]